MDIRTFVKLERALTHKLLKDWQERSGSLYARIAKLCREQNWEGARRVVPELDLTETGEANREYVKYMLLSVAVHGAGMVSKKEASFVGVGSFDGLLNKVVSNILQYLEHSATTQVQKQALQLIAQDEAEHKVQKGETYKNGSTQVDIDPKSEAAKALEAARAQIADEDLRVHGKETENHVTVRYGITSDDVAGIREYIAGLQPFEAELDGVEVFQPGQHSQGSCPVVAKVVSPDLQFIHHEISKHGQFLESQFPDYKPHATLAYVDADTADKYRNLQVKGKFKVTSITISHRSGVKEEVPFGITVQKDDISEADLNTAGKLNPEMGMPKRKKKKVKKADDTGRYVTPFVSFDNQGDDQLQLVSSLNASRLSTWGFTAEAQVRGINRYRITEQLDNRECDFCEMIHGREFSVSDARDLVTEALDAQNPDDLKTIQPWPKQDPTSLQQYRDMSEDQLVDANLQIPPYHPGCRGLLELVGHEEVQVPVEQATEIADQTITENTLQELGVKATQDDVDHWNSYVGLSPVQILEALSGKPATDILDGALGDKAIQFLNNGDIKFALQGVMDDVKYAVGTVLDPYSGTYYLTEADLVGDTEAAGKYLSRLLGSLVDVGVSTEAKSLVVAVGADAYSYVRMGFMPSAAQWEDIRTQALKSIESGELKGVVAQLDAEQQQLLVQLLQNGDESALGVLVDLPWTVEQFRIGEWILKDVTGDFVLDLTDQQAIQQAREYLS